MDIKVKNYGPDKHSNKFVGNPKDFENVKKTFDLDRHFTSEFFNESTQKVLFHVYTSINRYVATDFVISCGQ